MPAERLRFFDVEAWTSQPQTVVEQRLRRGFVSSTSGVARTAPSSPRSNARGEASFLRPLVELLRARPCEEQRLRRGFVSSTFVARRTDAFDSRSTIGSTAIVSGATPAKRLCFFDIKNGMEFFDTSYACEEASFLRPDWRG